MVWSLISRLCENRDNLVSLLRGNFLRDFVYVISIFRECFGLCVDTVIYVSEDKKVDWLLEWFYINMICNDLN